MAMAETNKNLSLTLERADTRCFNLEKKVVKLKKYHKIFKHADEISCKFCGKMVKKTLFMAHFEICNLNDDRNYDECSLYQVSQVILLFVGRLTVNIAPKLEYYT